MRPLHFTAAIFLTSALATFGEALHAAPLAGIGFTAPNVTGSAYVGNPQIGDIVFETPTNSFLGYAGGTPGWIPLGGGSATRSPTTQVFTASGPGTYTTPAGVVYIKVRMVGGGGGGWGSGDAAGSMPGVGTASIFGTLTAGGGGVAGAWNFTAGGAGGSASLGSGPVGMAVSGASGGPAQFSASSNIGIVGGAGGASAFGGAGAGGGSVLNNAGDGTGRSATANSGSGGGGGGVYGTPNVYSGTGGGAGGYVEAQIDSPAATYSFTVGGAGSAGGNGAFGEMGGAGAAGYISVQEFY